MLGHDFLLGWYAKKYPTATKFGQNFWAGGISLSGSKVIQVSNWVNFRLKMSIKQISKQET